MCWDYSTWMTYPLKFYKLYKRLIFCSGVLVLYNYFCIIFILTMNSLIWIIIIILIIIIIIINHNNYSVYKYGPSRAIPPIFKIAWVVPFMYRRSIDKWGELICLIINKLSLAIWHVWLWMHSIKFIIKLYINKSWQNCVVGLWIQL